MGTKDANPCFFLKIFSNVNMGTNSANLPFSYFIWETEGSLSHFPVYFVYGVTFGFCHPWLENNSYNIYLGLQKADYKKYDKIV